MRVSVRKIVRDHLQQALIAGQGKGLLTQLPSQVLLERPKHSEHGDCSTNIAVILVKAAGESLRVVGEAMAKPLRALGGNRLAEVSVAGPGFLNLRLSNAFCQRQFLDSTLRRLSDFFDYVADAAAVREFHQLVQYLQDLTGEFQSYSTRLQNVYPTSILPQQRERVGKWHATWNWRRTATRLEWVEAIRQVLEVALSLVGVSSPHEMKRSQAADGAELNVDDTWFN